VRQIRLSKSWSAARAGISVASASSPGTREPSAPDPHCGIDRGSAARSRPPRPAAPRQNEADLEDLPEDVRKSLTLHAVEELGEAQAITLRGASLREGRLFFAEPEEVKGGRRTPEIHH